MTHRTLFALLGACLVLALPGCGNKLVPVKGTVLLDGKPLLAATVDFAPAQPEPGSRWFPSGSTDENGNFFLLTKDQVGALPGKYKITVHKSSYLLKPPTVKRPLDDTSPKPLPTLISVKEVVPHKYSSVEETPFEEVVPNSGRDDIRLELSSKK